MRVRRALAVGTLVATIVATLAATLVVTAKIARGEDPSPLRVDLPLGARVRPGRPLCVRVAGGAARVRTGTSPWALPQGERNDEFVLPADEADAALLSLEVDRDGQVARVSVPVTPLPREGRVVGTFGHQGAPGDAAAAIRLPSSGLPTVREAWLLVDDVDRVPDGLRAAERAALVGWRDGPRAGAPGRSAFEPLLLPPDPAAFRAMAELDSRAPRLPDDVVSVLLVLAGVTIVLVLVLRSRGDAPLRRLAWLAVPPVAACAWLVAGARLPGAVRGSMVVLDGPEDRLVVVRVQALRAGEVRLRPPAAAGAPALLRFDAEDASLREAEVGREVRLALRAGESRLVAWRLPPSGSVAPPAGVAPGVGSAPPEAAAWLARLGLRVAGDAPEVSGDLVAGAEGLRLVTAARWRVAVAN